MVGQTGRLGPALKCIDQCARSAANPKGSNTGVAEVLQKPSAPIACCRSATNSNDFETLSWRENIPGELKQKLWIFVN